ncbi:low-specificity L-threonine aldolase [Schlesneria paludicola]|uniref:low-specificity L-threonine aldolase n=1 Tax=Schlesneria paludicola TaxID=360056 RepID=UPI00029B17F6|nr:low-specificity L-threonine aldolase [Schlesneria paludicola]
MTSPMIDLRSDTVTKPTAAMRHAIANAEVGDDVYSDDPTVNRLEQMVAEQLGKAAAVFNCSGTQSNQMAVRAHCAQGDEILIDESSHIVNYEAGGAAALSGVSLRVLRGRGGLFDVADLEGMVRPDNPHYSITRLVSVENTTNHGGGRVWPLAQMNRVADWAHDQGLQVHVDGARLFNAVTAGGYSAREFVKNADTVSVCFSKGLGCPMGSILVGDAESIRRARRARKLFGGGLRQAGMMAAAAIYALEHHVERLAEDHANARAFAEAVSTIDGVQLNVSDVESNLVFFGIEPKLGTAAQLSALLLKRGVRLNSMGTQRLRACTHLDVSRADVLRAAELVRECVSEGFGNLKDAATSAYSAR